jgi:CPA2 family monovalent cation:H+ antiporter-2
VHESFTLISTIAAAFGLALVLGILAVRIGLPALVGYLVAGVMLGPFTAGPTADAHLTRQLAEIGVMLMMFGVGLHIDIDDLLDVRRIAIPGALLQVTFATLIGAGLATLWGWTWGAALVFGLSLSVASTVVVLRTLEGRHLLGSFSGRIAVGWLVVEDLVMVVVLALLPPLAMLQDGAAIGGGGSVGREVLITFGGVASFLLLMFVVGRRVVPRLLWVVARSGSRELFTLSIIATAVVIAFAASRLFGVSFALGAFVAGMVISESELSHRAADESLPLRDAFSVLFFVSVGMLFDPALLWQAPDRIFLVLAIILLGNPVAAFLILILFRYPLNAALTVGASLAQIGEFSFIVAGMGVSLGLLSLEGQSLVLAGAVLSIGLNPLVFRLIEPARQWILTRSRVARLMVRPADRLAELPHSFTPERLTGHVVIVGYGRVGRRIGEALITQQVPIVVVEQSRDIVEELRARGHAAVTGDATKDPAALIQGHVMRARVLVVAIADPVGVRSMVATARQLRPDLPILVRTHGDEESELLRQEGAGEPFMGEHELAAAMTRAVLAKLEAPRPDARDQRRANP